MSLCTLILMDSQLFLSLLWLSAISRIILPFETDFSLQTTIINFINLFYNPKRNWYSFIFIFFANFLFSFKIIKYHGLYIEESSFEAPWKLLTRILNDVFLFYFYFYTLLSAIFTVYFSTLWSILSELLILFTPDLKSWPDVRHIVSRKFSSVSFIYTLCFCTMSFWMLRNFMNIFYESFWRLFIWSFRSFYRRFRWAISAAYWCFCNVYFLFLILSLIYRFFYSFSFSYSF